MKVVEFWDEWMLFWRSTILFCVISRSSLVACSTGEFSKWLDQCELQHECSLLVVPRRGCQKNGISNLTLATLWVTYTRGTGNSIGGLGCTQLLEQL